MALGSDIDDGSCHQPGGLCDTVKRAAEAAANAMPEAAPDANQGTIHHCFLEGNHCFKAKRALEGLNNIIGNIL